MSEFQKDIPILQEVVNGTWAKEKRLSELKTELAGIDRKIQLSINRNTRSARKSGVGKAESNSADFGKHCPD